MNLSFVSHISSEASSATSLWFKERKKKKVETVKWSEDMTFCVHVLWSNLNILRHIALHGLLFAIISNVITSPHTYWQRYQTYSLKQSINNQLWSFKQVLCSRKTCLVLVQTRGFPQAITISVIRSWKTNLNLWLLQSVAKIVLKLKYELWADTMLLWEHFQTERYP